MAELLTFHLKFNKNKNVHLNCIVFYFPLYSTYQICTGFPTSQPISPITRIKSQKYSLKWMANSLPGIYNFYEFIQSTTMRYLCKEQYRTCTLSFNERGNWVWKGQHFMICRLIVWVICKLAINGIWLTFYQKNITWHFTLKITDNFDLKLTTKLPQWINKVYLIYGWMCKLIDVKG